MANFKIALSAGHGMNTAGKRCMKALDPHETREWELNARIAEKVESFLSQYSGYELLRLDDRTGAKDVALKTRSKNANAWGANFYLAIHHNAGVKGGSGGGIVAYVYTSPSNESVAWQKELYDALIAETGLKGNRATPLGKANFHECREPKMASVLLELGFMDSTTDTPIILTDKYAYECAKAIANVIVKRGNLKPKYGSNAAPSTQEKVEESKPEITVDPARSFDKKKSGAYVVKSSDGILNLRAGADSSKALIEAMPTDSTVRCYGFHTGEWLYVKSAKGNLGFCHSGYLVKK